MKNKIANYSLIFSLIIIIFSGCINKTYDQTNPIPEETNALIEIPTITQEDVDITRQAFDAFTTALIPELLIASPVDATFLFGDLEQFDLEYLLYALDDFDQTAIDSSLQQSQEIITILKSFDYNMLTDEQKKTYEVLYFHNSLALESEPYIYYDHEIQPTSGAQINIPLALMQIEFESVTEAEAYLERLSNLPRLLGQFMDYEKERATMGLIMPEYQYDLVIEQINGMLVKPNEFMMYLSFCDRIDGIESIDAETKEDYKNRCLEIITTGIYPAYETMITELTLLKKSAIATAGISSLENGQEYYEFLIKCETSYEMSAEELKQWAYTELSDSITDIQIIISQYDDMSQIENLSQFFPQYSTLEEIYAIQDQCLNELFYDYQIENATEATIPSYLEDYLAAGFYFPVSVDGQDYGTMYLRESTYENIDASTLDLYFHENIPGHHMYFSYFYNSDIPLIRKLYSWLPYEEGWAQYIQNLSVQYYGVDEEIAALLQANNEIGYYYMILLDIGLHYDGVSREDAIATLVSLGYYEDSAISCIDRMIANPGEVIHYIYGYYKVNSYLETCQENLKDDFNIKSFHHMLLENADLPFYFMDDQVDKYIHEEKTNK